MRHLTYPWVIAPICAAMLALAGCMTPDRALREARETGNGLAGEYTAKITGRTNDFSIARPSDRLRNRLLAEHGLDADVAARLAASANAVPHDPLPNPLVLSLADAMRAGAANSEEYQTRKESVFSSALSLDQQRHAFETTFAGILGGGYSGETHENASDGEGGANGGTSTSSKSSGNASASLSRKFSNGMSAAASLGLDIVKLLTGGTGSTLGIDGDASITVPLLRGSGRRIAREALTQAERELVYAVYEFEAYRQAYAVQVASDYYNMLQAEQKLIALRDNQKRLAENYKRAQMLSDAGRLSQVELDQTRQNLLSTGDSLVEAERSRQAQLDSFKLSLGLPTDARIELDMGELGAVSGTMSLTETNSAGLPMQPKAKWTEDEAIAIALTNRYELIISEYRTEDLRRAVGIAEDNLNFDLALKGSAGIGRNKASGTKSADSSNYSLRLESDLPWDRRSERNAYEAAVRALEAKERNFEILKDKTRQLVRDDMRSLSSAWNSYVIQSEALAVAERRVRSTTLFQQAGRSSTRDLLDAEAALLQARNSVVGAIVTYRMAGLKLQRDMSTLAISEEGVILED